MTNKSKINREAADAGTAFLAQSIKEAEAQIKSLKAAEKLLKLEKNPARSLKFNIFLTSLWQSDGEKSYEVFARGQLATLIEGAEREFMRLNRRSDVQADYSIRLAVETGESCVFIPVPKTLWHPLILRNRS